VDTWITAGILALSVSPASSFCTATLACLKWHNQGNEKELPYMRTPLSKELWFKEGEGGSDGDGVTKGVGMSADAGSLSFTDWGGAKRSVYVMPVAIAYSRNHSLGHALVYLRPGRQRCYVSAPT
jgi:hypothetical protein